MDDPLDVLTEGLFSTTGLSVTTRGLLSGAGPLHDRAGIRQHVVAILKAESINKARVFESRKIPVNEDLLPALLVYTLSETAAKFDDSPRRIRRELQLAVEIVASALSNPLLDEQLDAIAHIVERVVASDPGLAGRAMDVLLSSTEIAFSEEGKTDHMSCRVVFTVSYMSEFAELAGDDLAQAHVGWDLAAPDGQKEAEDTISFGS